MNAKEAEMLSKKMKSIHRSKIMAEKRKKIYDMIEEACNKGFMSISGDGLYPGNEIDEELRKDGYYTKRSNSQLVYYYYVYWGNAAIECKRQDEFENEERSKSKRKWWQLKWNRD